MDIAISKEIEKKYLEAIELYEDRINNSEMPASVDYYVNLSFLYWEFAFEFNFSLNNIPEEWSIIGGERYRLIIEKGLAKYPNHVELHFWKKYYAIMWAENFSCKDCEALIEKYGDSSLVPYFLLYSCNAEKYKRQRDALLEICLKEPTDKHQYIYSIL